jgi:hypothetical protein
VALWRAEQEKKLKGKLKNYFKKIKILIILYKKKISLQEP